MILQRKFKDTN